MTAAARYSAMPPRHNNVLQQLNQVSRFDKLLFDQLSFDKLSFDELSVPQTVHSVICLFDKLSFDELSVRKIVVR